MVALLRREVVRIKRLPIPMFTKQIQTSSYKESREHTFLVSSTILNLPRLAEIAGRQIATHDHDRLALE